MLFAPWSLKPPPGRARGNGWLGVLAALVAAALTAFGDERPNVLFLLTDDQRADTIHALGNRHVRTPHLDRLARRGTAFTRAYIMGGLQGAVCVPSRAMLLSGRTLFRAPENLQGVETWPMKLGAAGYRTFITGKWHNQAASLKQSFAEGRAIFLGGMSNQNRIRVRDLGRDGSLTNDRVEERPSSELFADAAIEFLRGLRGDAPFCLYVAFTSPHDPRTPPPAFRSRYDPDHLPLPANYLPQHPFNNGELLIRDEKLLPWPRTPAALRREWADYYGMISHVDAQIGRILAALEESGRLENTLVVFAGDNGLALGSHGLLGKQNLYEHSVRVPLIVAGPGVKKNRRVDAFCYLLDLCPTLCELAGVPAPDGNEGISLAPLLRGERQTPRTSVFTAYRNVQRAVRDERWKLIRYPHINKSQLFDLKRDPHERHDLAAHPEHAPRLGRLTRLLEEQQQALGDRLALSTNQPAPPEIEFPRASAVPTP